MSDHSQNPFTLRRTSLFVRILLPLLLVIAGATLRTVSIEGFSPLYDERITRAVVENIWKGDLRNNWRYADVPREFKTDIYNFSSYLYLDALAVGPHADNPTHRERLFSAILGTLALVVFYFAVLDFFDRSTALLALAIMAVFPLLVQDSHYARPESFITLLCGVIYLLAAFILKSSRPVGLLVAASFCCGLLVACKVSLIPLALIPLACAVRRAGFTTRVLAIWIAALAAGTFSGMPDAFFHPRAFYHGLVLLRHQYSNEQLPHSLPDSHYCLRLLVPYFWQTAGPVCCVLSALGGIVLAFGRRWLQFALFAAPVAFYVLYFSAQRVFFERNMSQVVPLMAALAAIAVVFIAEKFPKSVRGVVIAALALLTVIPQARVAKTLVFDAMPTTTERRAQGYERSLMEREHLPEGSLFRVTSLADVLRQAQQSAGDFIVVTEDYCDPYTVIGRRELEQKAGAREVGRFPSLFPDFVPSTLHVYHSPGLRYHRVGRMQQSK